MSFRKVIKTADAPAAIGPYSQAIQVGPTLYMSGQIGLNPVTGEFAGNSLEAQTKQVLQNMKAVLSEAGMSFENLVMVTIYLASMDDFSEVNALYGEHMPTPAPARGTVAVKTLPKGARVEIVGVAHSGSNT